MIEQKLPETNKEYIRNIVTLLGEFKTKNILITKIFAYIDTVVTNNFIGGNMYLFIHVVKNRRTGMTKVNFHSIFEQRK